MKWVFEIGERVRPRKEWRRTMNAVPSGEVKARQPWGIEGCYQVGDDPRFWSAHVLEREPA